MSYSSTIDLLREACTYGSSVVPTPSASPPSPPPMAKPTPPLREFALAIPPSTSSVPLPPPPPDRGAGGGIGVVEGETHPDDGEAASSPCAPIRLLAEDFRPRIRVFPPPPPPPPPAPPLPPPAFPLASKCSCLLASVHAQTVKIAPFR